MAKEWGELSHCKRKKVGAIIVKNNMIISDGFNGAPSGFDNNCEDSEGNTNWYVLCLLYTSPSPRDRQKSRMPSSA